jgi:hypothetical protein
MIEEGLEKMQGCHSVLAQPPEWQLPEEQLDESLEQD